MRPNRFRTGELTRGMCVVDRRADEGTYAPGKNRAFVQAQLDLADVAHAEINATSTPAPVETETEEQAYAAAHQTPAVSVHVLPTSSAVVASKAAQEGVLCLVDTPGPRVLLNLLLDRIWATRLVDDLI
jgi:hypothetical protein